jgi:hypothetical protein
MPVTNWEALPSTTGRRKQSARRLRFPSAQPPNMVRIASRLLNTTKPVLPVALGSNSAFHPRRKPRLSDGKRRVSMRSSPKNGSPPNVGAIKSENMSMRIGQPNGYVFPTYLRLMSLAMGYLRLPWPAVTRETFGLSKFPPVSAFQEREPSLPTQSGSCPARYAAAQRRSEGASGLIAMFSSAAGLGLAGESERGNRRVLISHVIGSG